jgi:Flp pilus assembly protein TadG
MVTTNDRRGTGEARDRGAVAVEFVLLAPLLFLLLFGIVQFGRAYNAKIELTGAVREGARVLALGTGDPVARTLDAAPGLDPDAIEVSTSTDPCAAGTSSWVEAEYDFAIALPFWDPPPTVIKARGVMRCNG